MRCERTEAKAVESKSNGNDWFSFLAEPSQARRRFVFHVSARTARVRRQHGAGVRPEQLAYWPRPQGQVRRLPYDQLRCAHRRTKGTNFFCYSRSQSLKNGLKYIEFIAMSIFLVRSRGWTQLQCDRRLRQLACWRGIALQLRAEDSETVPSRHSICSYHHY